MSLIQWHCRLKFCWTRYAYNHEAMKDEFHRFDIIWEEVQNVLLTVLMQRIFYIEIFSTSTDSN